MYYVSKYNNATKELKIINKYKKYNDASDAIRNDAVRENNDSHDGLTILGKNNDFDEDLYSSGKYLIKTDTSYDLLSLKKPILDVSNQGFKILQSIDANENENLFFRTEDEFLYENESEGIYIIFNNNDSISIKKVYQDPNSWSFWKSNICQNLETFENHSNIEFMDYTSLSVRYLEEGLYFVKNWYDSTHKIIEKSYEDSIQCDLISQYYISKFDDHDTLKNINVKQIKKYKPTLKSNKYTTTVDKKTSYLNHQLLEELKPKLKERGKSN